MVLIATKNSGSGFQEGDYHADKFARFIPRHKMPPVHLWPVREATQKTTPCLSNAVQVYFLYQKLIAVGMKNQFAWI
jgi:hypothetical protein